MKKKISLFVIMVCSLVIYSPASAREVEFVRSFVDSNTYTYVTGATSEDWHTTIGAVGITDMFASDGSYAGYRNVWVKSDANQPVLAVRGGWVNVTFGRGDYFKPLYAMGHNPTLDCLICGYWNVH